MSAYTSDLQALAMRLQPGDDLKKSLGKVVTEGQVQAAAVLSAVGSLRQVTLRLADQREWSHYAGKFELVSLTGTLSEHGLHLHIAVADSAGRTIGGHLGDGCLVYTTAEIVLVKLTSLVFQRAHDTATGFRELKISVKPVR